MCPTPEKDVLVKQLEEPFERYWVYSDGRVWAEASFDKAHKPHFVKPYLINSGYLVVRMWAHNKEVKWLVHRLVATLFVDNPHQYNRVNHIDGNRQNNDYRNLEWCTQEYNLIHHASTQRNTDRSIHPFEFYNLETGENFIFHSYKPGLRYIGHGTIAGYHNKYWIEGYAGDWFYLFDNWICRLAVEFILTDFDWIDK